MVSIKLQGRVEQWPSSICVHKEEPVWRTHCILSGLFLWLSLAVIFGANAMSCNETLNTCGTDFMDKYWVSRRHIILDGSRPISHSGKMLCKTVALSM